MRALLTWPKLILAAALAVLVGVGVWLSVAGTGAVDQPSAPAGPLSPPASSGATPQLDLRTLPSTGPAPRPANCGRPSLAGASGAWLPDWLDDPNRPSLLASQASRLQLLDFFWLRLGASPDSIVRQPGNPAGSSLETVLGQAAAANPCGWRFITISDEQTPMPVMAQILLDPQARWRNVAALATAMAGYPAADGLTLDYEYALPSTRQDLDRYASAAHWQGLSVREEVGRITAGYTELVRELALAMHRQHRALRVAVRVRTTDEIDYQDPSDLAPFLYDYGELAKYADQIVLMAVDFHWSTSDPGPIVTMSDLRNVLNEVRTYDIPSTRLAVESPAYGYDWTVNRAGHRLPGTQAATVTGTDIVSRGWVKAGSKDGETYYEYTAGGSRHAVWFGGTGLEYQTGQLRRLCPGCAVMAWATGNTDPAGSALILQALGGLRSGQTRAGRKPRAGQAGRNPPGGWLVMRRTGRAGRGGPGGRAAGAASRPLRSAPPRLPCRSGSCPRTASADRRAAGGDGRQVPVSSQPPRVPTPSDLARVRPRLVSPPPSRRQADIESGRARQALRALLADPAANFAALPADEFFAALRSACQDGVTHPALIADAERRITSAEAGPRELHQVLFAARDHQAWSGARAAAMEAVVRGPAMAVAVLALETQRLGVAAMQVAESAAGDGFSARAWVERDGVRVEGEAGYGSSKKAARQAAALSLLAALTGLAIPDRNRLAARPAVPEPAVPERAVPERAVPELTAAELESWLDYEVGKPAPDPEFGGAVRSGRLSARSVCLLLFDADPDGWAEARAAAWEALDSTPSMAGGVLSMYSQARSLPTAGYIETGEYSAVAFLPTADGPVVGAPCLAAGSRAARAAAALALLRDLAPSAAPAGAGGPAGAGAERNPVAVLNERAQTGVITALSYAQEASGPPHEPVFTCTAGCTHATGRYTWVAEGRSKNEAKAAAAAGLLGQVAAQERSALAQLAKAAQAEARSLAGISGRLLRAGCALDFHRDRWFRISHPAGAELPGPLAGWAVPLLTALPVLATLDPNALPLHASARTWASAARSALEAVAAQRVYPALDGEGRDCWRLAADTAVTSPLLPEFLDAVADALLRPPGARLVIGDVPYAGRARVLEDEAAEWADRCAEAADPAPAAPMSVRIEPPADDGPPLRAGLHAPRLGEAEHRALRRATRSWPPLGQIRRDGTLGGADAADLLGPAGELLAAHGIAVEWPAELAIGLGTGTVARSRSAAGAFSLGDIVDLDWQLTLDGDPLSEAEAAAVAAAEGVVRLRGRWVLVDRGVTRRARERRAGELTGAQALSAALTGQIAVDGRDVACAGGGRLADVVAALRDAGGQRPAGIPDGLDATLRGYQRRAVQWLVQTTELGFGALLADDMGLGKTLMVIAFHLHRAAGPTLVVCPASLLANWEREFARFAPGVPVRRYHGAVRSLGGLAPGQVVVTTYGTLLRDAGQLAEVGWDVVVADEAQQVKNHRSQAARALRSLSGTARIAVTGTPVENSLSELWAILDWTNPGLFGTLPAFRERYGRAAEREADGDAARRLGRLISPFLMRRRKADPDVAPELPEKVVGDRYVELSREQAALYQAATAGTLARIAASAGIARRGQVLRLLQSLRQICNSPAHFLRESADGWDADAQAARSGKLQALEELMDSVAAAGEAALVFTGYVSMGHLIQAHLLARGMPSAFLHGGTPPAKRQEIVDRFQSGHGAALICSVRAAGTGLNLTRAGHVIHFDRPWNPAVEDQATDRAHRIGQHATVNVHHLIAEGTVEDRIAELLARKRGLTEAVLAGGESALTELDDGELRALVSLSQDLGAGGAA